MIKISSGSGLNKVFTSTVSHPEQSGTSSVSYTITHNKGVIIKQVVCILTNKPGFGPRIIDNFDGRQVSGSGTFNYYTFLNNTSLNSIRLDLFRMAESVVGSHAFTIELYA